MIIYRKAEQKDKKYLIDIERDFYAFDNEIHAYRQLHPIHSNDIPESVLEKMVEDCFSKEQFYFVADNGEKIIGFIYVEIQKVESEACYEVKSIGHIDSVYVAQEYRGQGIGTGLIKQAEEWLRSKDIKVFTIGVRKENKDALKLYEKLGFEIGNIKLWKEV